MQKKIFVFLCLLTVFNSAFAQTTELKFTGNKIIACTESGQVPYEMKDSQGNWFGFEVEMMRDFSKFEKKPFEIIDLKWAGVFPALYSHKCDMVIAAIGITPERAQNVDFSDSIIEDGVLALAYKDNIKFKEEYPDLHTYDKDSITIALPFGTISDLTAQKFIKHAKILKYETDTDSFQAFYNEKTDVFMNHKSYIQVMNLRHPGKFKHFKNRF